jgi:hypothetical protein
VRRALSGLSAKEWALEEELRDAARAKEQQRKRIDEAEARRAAELAGARYSLYYFTDFTTDCTTDFTTGFTANAAQGARRLGGRV